MKRVHIIVNGVVQGVFYRATAKEKASSLNLRGWVKNLYSGEVEMVIEGKTEKVEAFIKWAKKGPPGAVVNNISVIDENLTDDMDRFEIRY